jgi:hypothetical protein
MLEITNTCTKHITIDLGYSGYTDNCKATNMVGELTNKRQDLAHLCYQYEGHVKILIVFYTIYRSIRPASLQTCE